MDYQNHPVNQAWSAEGKIDLFCQMMAHPQVREEDDHVFQCRENGRLADSQHGTGIHRRRSAGDGSVNQGVYHESLNLAGLFGLPVIYVIENNGYAMGTSVSGSSRFTECLARRAETYGIDWDCFSDEDPYELQAKLKPALERAREHQRPTVLEISTCRYHGFSVADANHKKYRTNEEIEERKSRDPLERWGRRLLEDSLIDEVGLLEISDKARAEAIEAVGFAENGAAPAISEIGRDVYWESDHDTGSSGTGWHFFDN